MEENMREHLELLTEDELNEIEKFANQGIKDVSKKELLKALASGFVSGCSGTLVMAWTNAVPVTFPGMPGAFNKVVNMVGGYGIGSAVSSAVMKDTKENLDNLDLVIQNVKLKSQLKKTVDEVRKQKYTEVEEA